VPEIKISGYLTVMEFYSSPMWRIWRLIGQTKGETIGRNEIPEKKSEWLYFTRRNPSLDSSKLAKNVRYWERERGHGGLRT